MLVLFIVMVIIFGLFLINMALVQEPSFYIGIFSSLFIICVKLAAVFCQGPEMKNLSISITNEEGTFEFAFQFVLFLMIWLLGVLPDSSNFLIWLSPVSSVLLMSKSKAENMIIHSNDK